MAGEGFMSHAIKSLQMNRRGKSTRFSSEEPEYDNTPLGTKVASDQEIKEIATKVTQLKEAEKLRLYYVIIGLILLGVSIGIFIQLV